MFDHLIKTTPDWHEAFNKNFDAAGAKLSALDSDVNSHNAQAIASHEGAHGLSSGKRSSITGLSSAITIGAINAVRVASITADMMIAMILLFILFPPKFFFCGLSVYSYIRKLYEIKKNPL